MVAEAVTVARQSLLKMSFQVPTAIVVLPMQNHFAITLERLQDVAPLIFAGDNIRASSIEGASGKTSLPSWHSSQQGHFPLISHS